MSTPSTTSTSRTATPHLGLRARTALTLLLLAAVVLLLALWIGNQAVDRIRDHFGAAYARNNVLLNQQRIVTLIERELALARRLAESSLTREWINDESNVGKKRQFFTEADGYRRAFAGLSWFLVNANSGHYYYNDPRSASTEVRDTLRREADKDQWFYATLDSKRPYNINVDYNPELKATKVWFNVRIDSANGQPIGIAGTGLELDRFINDFILRRDDDREANLTNILLNANGTIIAHPDQQLIELSAVSKNKNTKTLHLLLGDDAERSRLQTAMTSLQKGQDQTEVFPVHLQGQPRLLAISRIADPELYVVSALDLAGSAILDRNLIIGAIVGGASLLALLILFATLGIDRLVLRPLTLLTASVREIANGRYDVRLASSRNDELGELTRAFDTMSQRVREHTELLEQRVAERTREVTEAHTILAETHSKLTDSIRYASLIQTAILPSRQLQDDFPGEHFVLWSPRDVVGGDLYLYRRQSVAGQEGHLVGIVDCAGHGVPGAFMTMIAHAALDLALRDTPANDPAAVLARVDGVVRQMLPTQQERFNRIVTSMDMGLCWIAAGSNNLTFAGAHINLYRYRNGDCQAWQGHRRGIGERRPGQYANHSVDGLRSDTFYLTTDGYLDQAGGSNGYGMGEGEFMRWIASSGAAPLNQQESALRQHLAGYQGPHPQRDDITVLAFRLP